MNLLTVKFKKDAYAFSDKELPHSICLKFLPGPLIRITRHFQWDPSEQNKKPKQISIQVCVEQEWFISSCTYVLWTVKNFDQTTFSI